MGIFIVKFLLAILIIQYLFWRNTLKVLMLITNSSYRCLNIIFSFYYLQIQAKVLQLSIIHCYPSIIVYYCLKCIKVLSFLPFKLLSSRTFINSIDCRLMSYFCFHDNLYLILKIFGSKNFMVFMYNKIMMFGIRFLFPSVFFKLFRFNFVL